jgi:hypothetical protein
MKTFADIKRKLIEGNALTMIRHDWYPQGKLMGVTRDIVKRQSNAIQLEGGSWLYLDKPAWEYVPLNEHEFLVRLDDDKYMGYRIN